MERTDITYFFEDFFKRNVEAFKNGSAYKDDVRRDCRFLNNVASSFPVSAGVVLTNYTQLLLQDIEWTQPLNHQLAINGFVQYFVEQYEIFKLIKQILTPDQFITDAQRNCMNEFTKGEQATKNIYMYLINKRLSAIYANWKNNAKYCKDAQMIHNKIVEIHNTHNIPFNFPDIQQIANNTTLLEPNQSWRTLLQTPTPTDNFIAYNKIWRLLTDYLVMMTGYTTTANVSGTLSYVEKKKKPVTDETLPEEKKKKKPIPVALKRKVWAKWMSEDTGKAKCMCCKLTDVTQLNFHCGHIISEAEGGELKVDNLKPICQSCNSSMGTTNMDEFMKKYGF
jgi:hypothetical protein